MWIWIEGLDLESQSGSGILPDRSDSGQLLKEILGYREIPGQRSMQDVTREEMEKKKNTIRASSNPIIG